MNAVCAQQSEILALTLGCRMMSLGPCWMSSALLGSAPWSKPSVVLHFFDDNVALMFSLINSAIFLTHVLAFYYKNKIIFMILTLALFFQMIIADNINQCF